MCVAFEKTQNYLILAFCYFVRNTQNENLVVEEFLHRINMNKLVAHYNYNIDSK